MADKSRPSETVTLRRAEQVVARAMPPGWVAKVVQAAGRSSGKRAASLRLRAPDGDPVDFDLVNASVLNPQDAVRLLDTVRASVRPGRREAASNVVVVSPYIGERARELLSAGGVSYIDSTGNVRLLADRPALFVLTTGATTDPWPDDQPLKTLRGRGAGRAVRAVIDFRPPFGVRELADKAEVSTATLARVIDLLAREALLTRDERGRVTDVDWAGSIRRWSKDYEFATSNRTTPLLAPRGLNDVTAKLKSVKWRYALTGSLAVRDTSPIAPARLGMLYVDDVESAMRALDLRDTDSGANVLLAEPFDRVVYERTTVADRLTSAAVSQIAADLLTGSGRLPAEGEELLAWMKANEHAWRR